MSETKELPCESCGLPARISPCFDCTHGGPIGSLPGDFSPNYRPNEDDPPAFIKLWKKWRIRFGHLKVIK